MDNDKENQVFSSSPRPATSFVSPTPLRERILNSSPAPDLSLSEARTPNESRTAHLGQSTSTRRSDVMLMQDYNGEGRQDSMSSRGSWIRRLSTIQVSQHGSPRSSIGPDSPSFTFSHGSAAPMLPATSGPSQSLPPNKLVKRTTSGRVYGGESPGSGSRPQIATLRRPATSHQRSVTLQQQLRQVEIDAMEATAKQRELIDEVPQSTIEYSSSDSHTRWRLYFESRGTRLTKERLSGRASDTSADTTYPTSRRIHVPEEFATPTLMKPGLIIECNATMPHWKEEFPPINSDTKKMINFINPTCEPSAKDIEEEKYKRLRHSLSMHLSSPASWISRTGSSRGTKGKGGRSSGNRYVSDPISLPGRATISAHGASTTRRKGIMDPTIYQNHMSESKEEASEYLLEAKGSRPRNTSSPLPPLSPLSGFNMDLGRMGPSPPSNDQQRSLTSPMSMVTIPSPSLTTARDKSMARSLSHFIHQQYRPQRLSEVAGSDRASTLVGSDNENREFVSSEDELDFPSDSAFDSIRTGATRSLRTPNSPLEHMFDESPPSSSSKARPFMILDISANAEFRDANNRIVEEDENMATPIRDMRLSAEDGRTPTKIASKMSSAKATPSSPTFSVTAKEFDRLSVEADEEEEEEEEDWTQDDDYAVISSPLSPPSCSMRSRHLSPPMRPALADLTKSGSSSGNAIPSDLRPKSVFDWSEPSVVEKTDMMGNSPRPKTVHGKRILDGRGGRTVGRRGPTAHHVRSQSVPIVPDVTCHREQTNLAPKFGTWGLGAKGVSEDWDNDFEFDNEDADDSANGESNVSNSTMLVPPAIQASQANVVGHVGQIREFCLLVEDLKRLRGLAREKGLLDEPPAGLWREAEGIIALAVPDDEDLTLSPPRSPISNSFDYESVDEKYRDGGFDIDELSSPRAASFSSNARPNGRAHDGYATRRRSFFSPENDIFGPTVSQRGGAEQSQSTYASHQHNSKNSTEVARFVMEHIHQHRAYSEPPCDTQTELPKKMPFDTTSLRDLVHRASTISRTLAEIIRKADALTQSPIRNRQDDRDSSPAFTRVFVDPLESPSKNLQRSQSNNSILNGSIDASPTGVMGQRIHMMTVA